MAKIFTQLSLEEIENEMEPIEVPSDPSSEIVADVDADDASNIENSVVNDSENVADLNEAGDETQTEIEKIDDFEESGASGDKAELAAAIATESLRHMKNKLGLANDETTITYENIKNDPMRELNLAREGFKETFYKIIAAIRAFLQKIWAKLKVYAAKIMAFIANYTKQIVNLRKELKEIKNTSIELNPNDEKDKALIEEIQKDNETVVKLFGTNKADNAIIPYDFYSIICPNISKEVSTAANDIAKTFGEMLKNDIPIDNTSNNAPESGDKNSKKDPAIELIANKLQGIFSIYTNRLGIFNDSYKIKGASDMSISIPIRLTSAKFFVIDPENDVRKIYITTDAEIKEPKNVAPLVFSISIQRLEKVLSFLEIMARGQRAANSAILGAGDVINKALDGVATFIKEEAKASEDDDFKEKSKCKLNEYRGLQTAVAILIPELMFMYTDVLKLGIKTIAKITKHLKEKEGAK